MGIFNTIVGVAAVLALGLAAGCAGAPVPGELVGDKAAAMGRAAPVARQQAAVPVATHRLPALPSAALDGGTLRDGTP